MNTYRCLHLGDKVSRIASIVVGGFLGKRRCLGRAALKGSSEDVKAANSDTESKDSEVRIR